VLLEFLLEDCPSFAHNGVNDLCSSRETVDKSHALSSNEREIVAQILRKRVPIDVTSNEVMPREGEDWRLRLAVGFDEGVP
jgi:hypothetical protein